MIALRCELIPDGQGKEATVYFNGIAPIDLSYKKPVGAIEQTNSIVKGKRAKRPKASLK